MFRLKTALGILGICFLGVQASAETAIPTPPHLENFFILGAGVGPDFIGSDDTTAAVAPAAQLSFGGGRSATLLGNMLKADLVPHPNWKIGPVGILRFGRDDVDDPAIAALPDIDMELDLGVSVAYEWRGGDIRDRWQLGGGAVMDTRGDFNLQTGWVNVQRWMAVGNYGALGLSVGGTWGAGDYMDRYFSVSETGASLSGLPEFNAGSGARDVRVAAVFVHPISPRAALGAGVLYARLLGDAADSPISQSDDQLYAGVGIAYA